MSLPLPAIFQESLGCRASIPRGFFLYSTVRSRTLRSCAKMLPVINRRRNESLIDLIGKRFFSDNFE
jgi:hypothetical protein